VTCKACSPGSFSVARSSTTCRICEPGRLASAASHLICTMRHAPHRCLVECSVSMRGRMQDILDVRKASPSALAATTLATPTKRAEMRPCAHDALRTHSATSASAPVPSGPRASASQVIRIMRQFHTARTTVSYQHHAPCNASCFIRREHRCREWALRIDPIQSRPDGWMDGWMDGWTAGWVPPPISGDVCTFEFDCRLLAP
jgi:hypothetical protein